MLRSRQISRVPEMVTARAVGSGSTTIRSIVCGVGADGIMTSVVNVPWTWQ